MEITYSSDGEGELTHGVESVGASINELFNEFRNLSSSSPFLRETLGLFSSRDFSSQKQPKESFGQRLRSSRSRGELLLTFRDGQSSESDTLIGIEDGSFPNEALDVRTMLPTSKDSEERKRW